LRVSQSGYTIYEDRIEHRFKSIFFNLTRLCLPLADKAEIYNCMLAQDKFEERMTAQNKWKSRGHSTSNMA